jgi:hypothetical protein
MRVSPRPEIRLIVRPASHIITATPMRFSVRLAIIVEHHRSSHKDTRGKITDSNRKRATQTQLASITAKRPAMAIAAPEATFLAPASIACLRDFVLGTP